MTRQLLRWICRALIGTILFAQLAVSAYACPGLSAAGGIAMQQTVPAATATASLGGDGVTTEPMAMHCENMTGPMGSSFANLCAEHCHQGQQISDAATMTVPAAILSVLYLAPVCPACLAALRPAAQAASARVVVSAPHTILHCCFRI
jgi:hypothetical protein